MMFQLSQRHLQSRNFVKSSSVSLLMLSALYSQLPTKLQYAVELASEKGASTWLTARPLAEHGFAISKLAFRDGLCL